MAPSAHMSNGSEKVHRQTQSLEPREAHLSHDIFAKNCSEIPYPYGDKTLSPGVARVNVAATIERPEGTVENNWARDHSEQTVLQQHCSYWDRNGNGIITPWDTYVGVRAWGWNPILCLIVVLVINGGLSYPTQSGWFPDPFFRIYLARIHRAKHGSDTMTYDHQGRFRPLAYEEIFNNYDKGDKGGLDIQDLIRAWYGQRNTLDPFGWSAFFFEWLATYLLVWPDSGTISKEAVRKVYDGSIFQEKADEYAARQKQQDTHKSTRKTVYG